ncbi:hypothetical protein BC831DRAFT_451069 [Entophlyctis helioformis]|nr:hypothetical protein BC831DRAFT_451069 [Entophlyctis helioformis]
MNLLSSLSEFWYMTVLGSTPCTPHSRSNVMRYSSMSAAPIRLNVCCSAMSASASAESIGDGCPAGATGGCGTTGDGATAWIGAPINSTGRGGPIERGAIRAVAAVAAMSILLTALVMAAMTLTKSSALIVRTADTPPGRLIRRTAEGMAIDGPTTDARRAACARLAMRTVAQAVNSVNLTMTTRALTSAAATTAKTAADGRACTTRTMP